MSVLELHAVSYAYPGADAPALREVSLSVEPGQLVVVAGASGAGKSSLLRAATGLAPHFFGGTFAGHVTVAGMDTRDNGPARLSEAIGAVFQDPETQIVMGTVRAELSFPLENRGWSPAAVARAVEETALALRIAELLDRSTAELSGGELQRVALGAALAGRPRLLVLDEPTSQLDPVAGDELIGLLRRYNEDFDTAILLCEQRLERCLAAADRVIAMAGGKVICDATPTGFLAWAAAAQPDLQTPAARLLSGLGLPPRAGVKAARGSLRQQGRLPSAAPGTEPVSTSPPPGRHRHRRSKRDPAPALEFDRVWHELREGAVILREVRLCLQPGERVALMGRNGAGKSTLLRHAAGLLAPTRGRVKVSGRVALLLQNPGDYLVADRVDQEASPEALARVGLGSPAFAARHPRELSGGERQRLALAVVLDGGEPPAVVALDEPTRGMDRHHREDLVGLLAGLEAAVLVATHDPEFAAAFADRVVMLADGRPIADGPAGEILSGGTYFATETARVLGGWRQILTPDQAARELRGASARATEVLA